MPLLLKKREEVEAHWFAVASEIGNVLPGPSKTYRPFWEKPAGTNATLVCERFRNESALRDTGLKVSIVPLIEAAPGESPMYWMSWYERWSPESKASSRKLQFQSSSISIFKGMQETPKLQLFRAEWSGVQKVEKQTDIFQGSGAAHPHWHFDALRGYLESMGRQAESVCEEPGIARGLAIEEFRDFGDNQTEQEAEDLFSPPAFQLPSQSEFKWTGIHLAASASWSDEIWPGPEGPHHMHARGPEHPESLRRWLSSCVRYVQAEINKAES